MSKIVFLGDTHFSVRNGSQHFHKFFETFYSETFFPYLIHNKIDTVIQLGDLYDPRVKISTNCASESNRYFFSKFDEYNIKLIALVGNHDSHFKESIAVNTPDLLLGIYNNIEIINSPVTKIFDCVSINLVPWICKENYDQCVKFIKKAKATMCVGHFELAGFKMYKNSITAEHGLTTELFSGYDTVLSGHYHHRSKKGNIEYIGTPYEMTWSDYDDQKGFYVFDTETREMEFVENPKAIFHLINYNDTEIGDKSTSDNMYLDPVFLNQFTNTYVKVKVEAKNNPYMFDLFLDKLYAMNPLDVSTIEDIVNIDTDESIDESDDTLTITYKYIDNINQQDLDTIKLKNIMNNLYNDALAVE